jgi:hypothetical protein
MRAFVLSNMIPIQAATSVKDQVKALHARSHFEPLRSMKSSARFQVVEFDCRVEALAMVTDWRVLGYTIDHSVITMRAFKADAILYWEKKHCIDSLLHRQKEMKLYKNLSLPAAKAACKKLNDRIAALIGPSQRAWIQYHNLAAVMMKDAHDFLVAHQVMTA